MSAPSKSAPSKRKVRVLVVDDSVVNRRAITTRLQATGEVGIGHWSPQTGSTRATVLIGLRRSRMPSRICSIVL